MTLKYLSMLVSIPAYSPLIDMVPSDPSRRITKNTGQSITVFTADQQLYRVAVNVVRVYPELPMTLFSV